MCPPPSLKCVAGTPSLLGLNIVGKCCFPLQGFALFCLAPLLAGLPTPEAESEGRGYPGLIQLDTNYVLPLLLAGAAFAKVALDR